MGQETLVRDRPLTCDEQEILESKSSVVLRPKRGGRFRQSPSSFCHDDSAMKAFPILEKVYHQAGDHLRLLLLRPSAGWPVDGVR